MNKELFEIGEVVFLKSDLKKRFPMVIKRRIDDLEPIYQTCWIDKKGIDQYNGFHAKMLEKYIVEK
jgi:hypothetical protein